MYALRYVYPLRESLYEIFNMIMPIIIVILIFLAVPPVLIMCPPFALCKALNITAKNEIKDITLLWLIYMCVNFIVCCFAIIFKRKLQETTRKFLVELNNNK